jgi:hypothetical protein
VIFPRALSSRYDQPRALSVKASGDIGAAQQESGTLIVICSEL